MEFMNAPNPYAGLGGPTSDIPGSVVFDDSHVWDTAVQLGVGADGPVLVDLDSESPHILVNAPTGFGKSTVARNVAVQRAAQGDLVVVLDRKMHSHPWARGLAPLTHYADDIPSIGSALFNLGRELHRRNQVVRDGGDPGPRVVVIFEETNATLTQLREFDKRLAPGVPGALAAFQDLMFMGRAVRMHVIAFAQLASYRSGLTADVLECFATRVMVGYSEKAWKWLASDCGRYRVAPSEIGRGMVCRAGKAVETQLTLIGEDDAASFVTSSVPAQRAARRLVGNRRNLPEVWRSAIGR